ncbi:MAG: hypothetical protein ACI89E_000585 [Planctomycetota bacterium]|jgi:hypothetical protein
MRHGFPVNPCHQAHTVIQQVGKHGVAAGEEELEGDTSKGERSCSGEERPAPGAAQGYASKRGVATGD